MKPSLPIAGGALLLVVCCASFAPVAAESPAPLPPPRLDVEILPAPATAPKINPLTSRYPMVIVEVDPSAFPMPVTRGRVGNYPIRIIPPGDVEHPATAPLLTQPLLTQPPRVYPAPPKASGPRKK